MLSLLSLIASREFSKYIAASILTAIGSGMYFVAISWYIYKTSGSAMAVGWVLIFSSLPGLLFSPWIGVLVDRWNVRVICIVTDFARALILICVAVSMYYEVLGLELIYLATFLIALCENFFQPAVGALIRDIVPKERLLEANVSSSMSMQVGLLMGASIGGFLVAVFGTQYVVVINVISFSISGLLTLWIKHTPALKQIIHTVDAPGALKEFYQAIHYAIGTRFVVGLAIQQMLIYVTLSVCNTLLPIFADKELSAGAQGFGLIDAAWGVGAIAGGFSLTYLVKKISPEWFGIFGLGGIALLLFMFLSANGVPQAAMAYFLLGGFVVMIRVNSDTLIATGVDPAQFGKVKAAISMLISYMSLIAYAGVGYLGDVISVRWIYLALSAVILCSALGMLWITLSQKPLVSEIGKVDGVTQAIEDA
ncbi:MFS transporter [Pseudomonas fluorescens]|uniref:MFS transporter n=1 Tax=Pseudomonas TaxID=286 RepID=UPI0019049C6A|nr:MULTISPECIES: MFS transporter [Pseudomonas]MBD8092939.1 MFS transporter [Pseudomonas fluorescens]MBD8718959.1 MFS transporter [Pseudomonas fluorescens]MDL2187133.1 MFS transporter [Pseudomonas sp. ChxA]